MEAINTIREEVITTNYYLLEAMAKGDKVGVIKWKIILDNLIDIYLKDENKAEYL
jgi:hypothetical protein